MDLARIRKRAMDPATRTDLAKTIIHPPATDAEIAAAEIELGFHLPASLRTIYQTIGNGGFGPGYGLMGVGLGFQDDVGDDLVAAYKKFAEGNFGWPSGLLRVCHWGCAIYSCIDSRNAEAPVRVWDPNNWSERDPVQTGIALEAHSFDKWISDWSSGVNLWNQLEIALSAKLLQRD